MSQQLLEEARGALDEAEELLGRLAPLSADHETVALTVGRLQHAHDTLSARRVMSDDAIASSRSTIHDAWSVIIGVRLKNEMGV